MVKRALSLAIALLLALMPPDIAAAATAKPGCSDPPGIVHLDGRPVLEIRKAPAAQALDDYVARAEMTLRRLAEDHTIRPRQLSVWDEPPYAMVGLEVGDGSRRGPGPIKGPSQAGFPPVPDWDSLEAYRS